MPNRPKVFEGNLARIAGFSLRDATSPHVVITPLVHRPSDKSGRERRRGEVWYFMVAVCGPAGFRTDEFVVGPRDEAVRMAYIAELMRRRPPLVIHVCASELEAIRLCEALWPGDRVSRLRAQIEAEELQT